MPGNNIPFDPGDSRYKKSNRAPVQNFGRKHSGAPGNSNSPQLAGPYPNGRANSGKSADGPSVLQRAAGRRLFGAKPGGFVAHKTAPDL